MLTISNQATTDLFLSGMKIKTNRSAVDITLASKTQTSDHTEFKNDKFLESPTTKHLQKFLRHETVLKEWLRHPGSKLTSIPNVCKV